VPRRAKWFIGDLTTVEHLHTVTRRVAEGNNLSDATLVRPPGREGTEIGGADPPRRAGPEIGGCRPPSSWGV
jgi:hypothetical protein